VLCAVARPLSVPAWLSTPLLFAAAVLGLTALGGALVGAGWPVVVSSALCGGAAAVTAVAQGGAVTWRSPRQRALLAPPYPMSLLLVGMVFASMVVP